MWKMLSVISFVLVMRLSACLHLGTTAHRINTRGHSQDEQNLPHSISPVPHSIPLVTSFLGSLFSRGVSQRRLNQGLQARRHRRSLSITNSFDVLRSRLLNSIKMGYVTFGENTDQAREKGGLKDIG